MHTTGARPLVGGGIALGTMLFVLPISMFEVFTGTAESATIATFVLGIALLTCGVCLIVTGLLARSRDLRSQRTYESINYDTPSYTTRQGNTGARNGTGAFNVPQLSGGGCAGDIGGS
ncbi:hypothetical protein [Arthrobacter flavus]|uniref:Uncharacterized protein n=1 Tax=Arthrobacter flavus TaxID=95172 RepID=A0ABW4Q842_9MICC